MITEITKEKFLSFVRLQVDGSLNMWDRTVESICGLTKDEHLDIIKNYSRYSDEFGITYQMVADSLAE